MYNLCPAQPNSWCSSISTFLGQTSARPSHCFEWKIVPCCPRRATARTLCVEMRKSGSLNLGEFLWRTIQLFDCPASIVWCQFRSQHTESTSWKPIASILNHHQNTSIYIYIYAMCVPSGNIAHEHDLSYEIDLRIASPRSNSRFSDPSIVSLRLVLLWFHYIYLHILRYDILTAYILHTHNTSADYMSLCDIAIHHRVLLEPPNFPLTLHLQP